MSENKMEVFEAKILNEPGEGFQSGDLIYTIAKRLQAHKAGKIIGGYKPDGAPGGWYDPGDLAPKDALYATEYALTRGLNPFGHIHLWYHRTNNQPPLLIIDVDYKVLKGWAESMSAFSSYTLPITNGEHGMQPGDIGAICYVVLDSDKAYFHKYVMMFLEQGKTPREAQSLAYELCAKSCGIGLVRKSEMTSKNGKAIPAPKGRSWQWRAETRAMRDAVRRSHGEPPPHKIREMAQATGIGISEKQVAMLASPEFPVGLPAPEQERFLQLEARAQEQKAGAAPKHDMTLASNLMWGNEDDDILAEPTPPEPAPEIEEGETIQAEEQPEPEPKYLTKGEFFTQARDILNLPVETTAQLLKEGGFKKYIPEKSGEMWDYLTKSKMPQQVAVETMLTEPEPTPKPEPKKAAPKKKATAKKPAKKPQPPQDSGELGTWAPETEDEFYKGMSGYLEWTEGTITEELEALGYTEFKPEAVPDMVRKLEEIRDGKRSAAGIEIPF